MARPTWEEYFLEVMHALQKRATCDRGKCACVIVKDNQILCTGYVGAPAGLPHCDDVGHLIRASVEVDGKLHDHCIRTVHAEQNAICQAAKRGVAIDGATIYVGMTPCRTCAMLLISCGIKKVIAERKYHAGQESEEMFAQAGVELVFVNDEVLEYNNK